MKRLLSNKLAPILALVSAKASSDFAYTSAAQGVGLATSFITALLVTNRLGVDNLGAYALVVSIATFISTLAEVGVGQTATRYASVATAKSETNQCNAVLAWSINIRVVFAVASILTGLLFADWLGTHVWGEGKSKELLLHAFVLGAATILQQCANAYFQTHQKFRFISMTTFFNSTLILVGALLLDNLGLFNLVSLIIISIAAALLTFSLVMINTPWREIYNTSQPRRLFFYFSIKLNTIQATAQTVDFAYGIKPRTFAIYLLSSSLIVTLFTRLDIWMIGALMTEGDVGIYKLASYFAIPLAMAVGSLNTILWPRASKLLTEEDIRNFLHRTVRVSLLLMLPVAVYGAALQWLPALIFPANATVIQGLALTLCARYVLAMLITPVAVVGYAIGMSRIYVIVNTLQLISIFLINYYFMDSLGLYAPALSLIVSELISVAIIWPVMRSRVRTLASHF